jgi:hypothetical protein
MNTKDKQDQKKNQRQKSRQRPGSKKQSRNSHVLHEMRHEHELPESRMFR